MNKQLTVFILAISISGCAANGMHQPSSVKAAQNRDRITGILGGGAIGAATGAAIGAAFGDAGKGAAIGAAIGSLGGVVAGDTVAGKRGNYAQKHDAIENAIIHIDHKISQIDNDLKVLNEQIRNRNQEILQLSQKNKLQTDDINKARIILAQLENDINEHNELSINTQTEIQLVEQDIASVETSLSSNPNNDELAKVKNELTKRKITLLASLEKINGISPQLDSQKEQLDTLLHS